MVVIDINSVHASHLLAEGRPFSRQAELFLAKSMQVMGVIQPQINYASSSHVVSASTVGYL